MDYRLKTMGIGEVLDTAFHVLKEDFWLLCAITGAVVFIPQFLPSVFRHYVEALPKDPSQFTPEMLPLLIVFLGVSVLVWIAMLIFGPFANAAVMKVVADRYLGNPTSFRAAYGYVFRRFWKLMTAVLVSGLLIVLGTFCCIVPGVLLMLHYFVVSAVVVVEDTGGLAAMRRSGQLMAGNKAMAFVLWILVAVLSATANSMFLIVPQILVRGLLQACFNVVSQAFLQVIVTIVYLHTRCQKEAFDLERLADALGTAGTSAEA